MSVERRFEVVHTGLRPAVLPVPGSLRAGT
jgi:hypothetical protein